MTFTAIPNSLRFATGAAAVLALSILYVAADAHAGEPVHFVGGHAATVLDPPNVEFFNFSIQQDADGSVAGVGSSTGVYLAPDYINPSEETPEFAGWTWTMEFDTLIVLGNIAYLEGVVIYDNRFNDEGLRFSITVVDNGSGAADPPDMLFFGYPLEYVLEKLMNDPEWAVRYEVPGNITVR